MELRRALRLIVVTDEGLAAPRSLDEVVREAVAAGAPAVQLRAKTTPAGALYDLASRVAGPVREAGALLFVNDRMDVALAVGADGVHVGPDDPPVFALRRVAPPGFLIGASTDDPSEALRLEAEGASYIGCGTVYDTGTKPDAGIAIGLDRLDEVARAVSIPVVGIGGITPERSGEVARTAAAGVAVVGAVMRALDIHATVRGLLDPWNDR